MNQDFIKNQLKIDETCFFSEKLKKDCVVYKDNNINIERKKNKDKLYINGNSAIEYFGCNYDSNKSCREFYGIIKMGDYYEISILSEIFINKYIIDINGKIINNDIIKNIFPNIAKKDADYVSHPTISSISLNRADNEMIIYTSFTIGCEDGCQCDDYYDIKEDSQKFGFVEAYFSIPVDKKTGKLGNAITKYYYTLKDFEKDLNSFDDYEIMRISDDGECKIYQEIEDEDEEDE